VLLSLDAPGPSTVAGRLRWLISYGHSKTRHDAMEGRLTSLEPARRRRIVRIQEKICVPRQRKVVHRERAERFCRLELVWRHTRRRNLREAVGYEEDEDDEQPICWALDLKVAEERVGAEEVERLVDDVQCAGIGYTGVLPVSLCTVCVTIPSLTCRRWPA
jgi:hypothetical protein